MGYYTKYELNCNPEKDEIDIVLNARKDDFYGITGDDECKWYDHEERMKELSKQFPDVIFVLSGEGEETGDVWRKKFVAGEMTTARAQIVFPDFT